jgi:hypothetical protein
MAKLGLAQGEPAGPLLRGPVDFVLPVPLPYLDASLPEASRPVAGAPPTKGMTWEPSSYADDTNLEAEQNSLH